MTITFPHVEDYIELLAGYDPAQNHVLFNVVANKFSLARYDVNVVNSMAESTVWNQLAYTDKQGELAIRLVLKYKRQYAQHGVDIAPVETSPKFRNPLRTIDRRQRIWRENDNLLIKFPYNNTWIAEFKKFKETAQGRADWNHTEKHWELGITEYNINWIVTWGQLNKFSVEPEVIDLYNKVIAAEETPYSIMLTTAGDKFTITNAAPGLIEYVEEHLGGFGLDNITRLVDNAGVLGYTVDPKLEYPDLLDLFGTERVVHVPSTEPGSLDLIFDYAELTGRWPVCIYNPGNTQTIDLSRFNDDEVVKFDPAGRTKTRDYNYHTLKVVYANRIPKGWNWSIPLMVSTVEMMYGGTRLEWVNRAEKIIHYSYIPLKEK